MFKEIELCKQKFFCKEIIAKLQEYFFDSSYNTDVTNKNKFLLKLNFKILFLIVLEILFKRKVRSTEYDIIKLII